MAYFCDRQYKLNCETSSENGRQVSEQEKYVKTDRRLATYASASNLIEYRKTDWHSIQYPDWTQKFTLKEKMDNKATYVLTYENVKSKVYLDGKQVEMCGLRFSVEADEMVECFCNGVFVDVSFWGPHRFDVGNFLQEGENEICLVITGNIANIYEDAGIAFGLKAN